MFKKGQILRNRVTGCAVLVLEWPEVKRLSAPRIGRAPIGRVYHVAKGCDHLFALIGNNYQERRTRKALPEQRGCRKEDC